MQFSAGKSFPKNDVTCLILRPSNVNDTAFLNNLVEALGSGKLCQIRIHEEHRTSNWTPTIATEELT